MTVSEIIKKLETMPLSAEVDIVKALSEDEFNAAKTVEISEEGKIILIENGVVEIESMDNKVKIYCSD